MEYQEDEEDGGLRLLRKSGIPLLYIVGICSNIVGMVCFALITSYWTNISDPMCFLFATTANKNPLKNYVWGGNLANCYWVSYGAIPTTLIALGCSAVYLFAVFGDPIDRKEEEVMVKNTKWITVFMLIGAILQLAVCASIAEGLRVTCANTTYNHNSKTSISCMQKIDKRVMQHNLPVQSSTMIIAGHMSMWAGEFCFVILVICHLVAWSRMR